ncbi:hypothetical protein GCM10010446_24430 [Streptomyces enissocaesilis]|uniref:Transposase n=1 Tax=Streptomyces enissocaesilis TaxID=332589 RepID=A0ABN3X738_9ACTN
MVARSQTHSGPLGRGPSECLENRGSAPDRRGLSIEPTGYYWLTGLPATTPVHDLVRWVKTHRHIEHDCRELKYGLGLDRFEGRTGPGPVPPRPPSPPSLRPSPPSGGPPPQPQVPA